MRSWEDSIRSVIAFQGNTPATLAGTLGGAEHEIGGVGLAIHPWIGRVGLEVGGVGHRIGGQARMSKFEPCPSCRPFRFRAFRPFLALRRRVLLACSASADPGPSRDLASSAHV